MKSIFLALCLVGYVSCMQRSIWPRNLQETSIPLDKYIDSVKTPDRGARPHANPDPVAHSSSPQFPVRVRSFPQFPIRQEPGAPQHLTRILPPWLFRNVPMRSRVPVGDLLDQLPYFKGDAPGLQFPFSGKSMDKLALLSEYTQELKRHNLDKSFH